MSDDNTPWGCFAIITAAVITAIVGPLVVSHLQQSEQVEQQTLRATISAMQAEFIANATPPTPTNPPVSIIVVTPTAPTQAQNPIEPAPATLPPPLPTQIPVPTPTETPLPPDTALGTILEVGQTWQQEGAELTLKNTQMDPNHVLFSFEFTNRKPYQISIAFTNDSFAVSDNRGRDYTICFFFNGCWQSHGSATLQPGDTWVLREGGGGALGVDVITSDPELSQLIITVKNISTISEARWGVPIRH